MQKFFLFFVKKLLTKFLSHSIISNVSGTRQNTKEYARVAQLVEHDLAKVGAAGSSPVSRSLNRVSGIPVTEYNTYARVAQLVEHDLAKVGAAGSSPVSRSFYFPSKFAIC